jgi:hypothetical protein
MKNVSGVGVAFAGELTADKAKKHNFLVSTHWVVECYDNDGKLKFIERMENICTAEGLNRLLDVMFHGTTQITPWYIVIFENDYTPIDGNTYATPGYTECTAYDEATRPEFVESAASSKSLSNTANKATFTINATKTLYGASLVGGGTAASTKGDAAGGGVLYAGAKFSSSQGVESGNTFKVTCTITSSDVP